MRRGEGRGRASGGRGVRRGERRRRLPRRRDEYNYDDYNDYDDNDNQLDLIEPSLDNLLSTPQIFYSNIDKEDIENKLSLLDFKRRNINKFKEDLLYYYSSPEILKKFKTSIDEEKNYDFYKDLDSENFIIEQKKRIETIMALPKLNLDSVIKTRKLSKYENIFCIQPNSVNQRDDYYENNRRENKDEETKAKLISANSIRKKMDEISNLCLNEKEETKILSQLRNLNENFKNNKIDIESLGFVHFQFIENNLVLLLTVIFQKFAQNKNSKNINDFILLCTDILKYF